MRRILATVAGATAAAALAGAASAQPPGPGVRVEHAVARLVVIAEPRNDVSVTVHQGDSRLPPLRMRREGGVMVVDGGLDAPFRGDRTIDCIGGRTFGRFPRLFGGQIAHVRDSRAVQVGGVGRIDYDALPVVTARVPLDPSLATSGAVYGQVGATDSLRLSTVGCGDWTAGPVRGRLFVDSAGSGDVTVADVGEAHARLAGSGDLQVGAVRGSGDLSLAGSGNVTTGPVDGPVRLSLAGSGDVTLARVDAPVTAQMASSGGIRIQAGRSPDVHVSVAGSGDFTFDGEAGRLSASVVGSGDVRVARVTGPVSKSVMGSGEVEVGGGR